MHRRHGPTWGPIFSTPTAPMYGCPDASAMREGGARWTLGSDKTGRKRKWDSAKSAARSCFRPRRRALLS
eukprot:235285-Pyramimonas_sp.AAC.1